MIGLGFLFYFKNMVRSALAISLLILFTIPLIMFLQVINTNYFFLISDLCDSINQAIYENNMPIYGKGLGWLSHCHSSETKTKGYMYNYDLYKAYTSLQTKMDALDDTTSSKYTTYKSIQTSILSVKQANLDPILTCDSVYNSLISNEVNICSSGPEKSYNIFIMYFWLMITVLFLFWAFNRNVMLIKRKIYNIHERLMAEESAY